ncbi:hypothetical protein MKEN_00863700 [Mycena kentingensis (nom. inval.)]|nr:hypothetical protein MKEN_00863700 [Mycena kentingensis (nom. inval.)]
MVHLGFATLLLGVSVAAHKHTASPKTYHIPSVPPSGPSKAQFAYDGLGADAPKVVPVNSTSFDWWYFDVVSTDPGDLSSVVVTFFTSTATAFPSLDEGGSLTPVRIWGSYPNGTLWEAIGDSGKGATVVADGDSSSGVWHGTGFSWNSTSPSTYTITIDAAELGISGTIDFHSSSPGHLPCGPIEAECTTEVGPRIGWVNPVPDSDASVHLRVNGTHVNFTGAGYHDKNWSDIPFGATFQSWYWGHGRFGPYSIVWFDLLDNDGKEHFSVYLAELEHKTRKLRVASCTAGSVKVRPQPNVYPPHLTTPDPTGYNIAVKDHDYGAGSIDIQATVLLPLVGANPAYTRSFAKLTAEVEGKTYEGTAVLEQFKLRPYGCCSRTNYKIGIPFKHHLPGPK